MNKVIEERAAEPGYGLEFAFVPVLSALKNNSEAVLGAQIEVAHLATPWIREFREVWPDDVFLASLRMVGIQRGIDNQHKPTHANEANAVLAGNGLQLCHECSCVAGPPKGIDIFYYIKFVDLTLRLTAAHPAPFMLIFCSLMDTALYTSTQSNTCLYLAWDGKVSIDKSYGLVNLLAHDTQQSWDSLEEKLFLDIATHTKGDSTCDPMMMVLVAGDGATNAQFLAMTGRVVNRLQAMCDQLPPPPYMNSHGELAPRTKIEYIVSEDAIFGAAKGAAFAMHTAFWHYCESIDMSKAWGNCWGRDDDFWYSVKEGIEANTSVRTV